MSEAPRKKTWIKKAIKHPGALREELHAPKGKPIPEAKLKKAEHSDNPKLRHRAQLADTLRSFHGGKSARSERLYGAKTVKRG